MEISLLIRRIEFLEARAEALDTLRQRIHVYIPAGIFRARSGTPPESLR